MAIDEVGGASEAGPAGAPVSADPAEAPEQTATATATAAPTTSVEAATADDTATANDAASARAHWFVFFGLAATVLVLDQLTKAWLISTISPGEVIHVLGDWVRLIYTQNSGALFGLFRDNAVLFGIVSIAVIALIVVYHRQVGSSVYLSVALGLLLGGALGNMTDRLRLGFVVDFVDIGIGDFRWYTFNVADAAISLAIVMLIGAALIPSLAGLGERRSDG